MYQIDTGFAYFGVIVEDGIVTNTAPIAKWMIGKRWESCEQYWLNRKATIIKV